MKSIHDEIAAAIVRGDKEAALHIMECRLLQKEMEQASKGFEFTATGENKGLWGTGDMGKISMEQSAPVEVIQN